MKSELLKMMIKTRFIYWLLAFVLIILLGVSVIFFIFSGWIRSNQHQIQEYSSKAAETEVSSKQDLDLAIKKNEEEMAQLQAWTLKPGEQSKMIALITRLAEDQGIALIKVEPAKEDLAKEGGKKLKPHLFQLSMEGGFKNLGFFLEKLECDSLAVTIEQLELRSHETNPDALQVQMSVAAYEEKPVA